jgi:hypothetical protein
VQPGHATSSSLSVEHRPAVCAIKAGSFSQRSHEKSVSQLGWSVENPRPPLAVCRLSRVMFGSVETYAEPSHVEPEGRRPRTVGFGEMTLPLEWRSVFEGLSCCCDGPSAPASVSPSDELPLAEPALFLRHLWHFFLNPRLVFSHLYWPQSHDGALGSTIIDFRFVCFRLCRVKAIESATTMSTEYT